MSQLVSENTIQTLEVIAAILRCFIITVVALIFVWSAVLVMGDALY